jgi:CHAT domain-containing protein/tetratricopeptide (TPR) repeat protein
VDQDARLQQLLEGFKSREDWPGAVRNRLMAASAAAVAGRGDRVRIHTAEAVEIARAHQLYLDEIKGEIQGLTMLLSLDRSGRAIDELRAKADFRYCAESDFSCQDTIKGEIGARLAKCCEDASRAFKQVNELPDWCKDAADASAAVDFIAAAERQAKAFNFAEIAGGFKNLADELRKQSTDGITIKGAKGLAQRALVDVELLQAKLQTDLLLLVCSFYQAVNDLDTPLEILPVAERGAGSNAESLMAVWSVWSDVYQASGRLAEAIEAARKALSFSERIVAAHTRAQAAEKLNSLLRKSTDSVTAMRETPLAPSEKIQPFLESAIQALQVNDLAKARAICDMALDTATSPMARHQVIHLRAVALIELGQLDDARLDVEEALAFLERSIAGDQTANSYSIDRRAFECEELHLLHAFIAFRQGRNGDAWAAAERGRSFTLKREISVRDEVGDDHSNDPDFPTIAKWIAAENVAILTISLTRWGALVMTAAPGEVTPEVEIVPLPSRKELSEILNARESIDGRKWTERIFEQIEPISEALIGPIGSRLQRIVRETRALYIIPHDFLFLIPFAALKLRSGRPLITLAPLAMAPSIGVLLWIASRRAVCARRKCLAAAVGDADREFADKLKQVSCAPWDDPPVELLDQEVTLQRLEELAPNYNVLYFFCHGVVNDEVKDVMASSQLKLASGKRLTARDVLGWRLEAEVVFLNACQSGRFRLSGRTEINGFARAFLLAGARAIIAPTIHIRPEAAGNLAKAFFQSWLSGKTRAQALQEAQISLLDCSPCEWASHTLLGDHC